MFNRRPPLPPAVMPTLHAGPDFAGAIRDIAGKASELGRGAAELDGTIEDVVASGNRQVAEIGQLAADMQAMVKSNRAIESSGQASRVAMGQARDAVAQVEASVNEIVAATQRNLQTCQAVTTEVGTVAASVATSAETLKRVNANTRSFLQASEALAEITNECGAVTPDTPFIEAVQRGAARLAAALEQAVAGGRISMADLFDDKYQPVAGSNPAQVTTRFVALTDELFPPVQEELLAFDSKVVFCAAVDRNGYLPTHNLKFSQPQGADPVWNAANARNRRLFNDRTGLAAGRNERRFLLQTYRRDMGGGKRVLMKDLSAPITVQGRHWGGLRLAYSF